MADNVSITPGVGLNIAADDIGGGVLAQRVKPVFGVDGTGVDVSASNPLPVTDAAAAASLASIATAVADTTTNSKIIMSLPYQAVAVSQTAKLLGATGAIGDTLQGIIIQPTGTTVGSVIVYDNVTAVYTYPGGTVGADLTPIVIGMGMACVGAGWHVTTPSNATVLALGKFT